MTHDDQRHLQLMLMQLGYDLPRFGADGYIGDETHDAIDAFAADHGKPKPASGKITDAYLNLAIVWLREIIEHATTVEAPACLRDTTQEHPGAKRLRRRGWDKITGITLHQTATCYLADHAPASKIQPAVARVSKIGVHGVVLRNGIAVYSNPLDWEMPQAQAFNPCDIGIEIDGYFAGVEGDDRTFWRPASTPDRQPMGESKAQTDAALAMIRYFCQLVASHGGRIRYLHAHRQTSATRQSDPGEMIWKTIALPAMAEHGLTDGGDGFFVPHTRDRKRGQLSTSAGPGRPIPHQWDPSRTSPY